MTAFASVDNRPLVEATITIPYLGLWTANLLLSGEELPGATRAKLVVAGLSLVGSTIRAGSFAGSSRVRMVGGGGGWRKVIAAKYYTLDAGVKLSTILKDAASETGEDMAIETDRSIGPQFWRAFGPAAQTLNYLAPSWYVDNAGKTVVADRKESEIKPVFSLVGFDHAKGIAEVASESIEEFIPGKVIALGGVAKKISSVMHTVKGSAVRTELTVLP